MAARMEWTEWHLTPRGWERGSTRVQGKGNMWVDEPEDRALSFVYKEIESPSQPGVQKSVEETWRPRDTTGFPGPIAPAPPLCAETEELLREHGPCPQAL